MGGMLVGMGMNAMEGMGEMGGLEKAAGGLEQAAGALEQAAGGIEQAVSGMMGGIQGQSQSNGAGGPEGQSGPQGPAQVVLKVKAVRRVLNRSFLRHCNSFPRSCSN